MAGPAPKTEKWTARENLHKPEGLHLLVNGNVLVQDADKAPVLTKGEDKAPKRLSLELSIVDCNDPAIDAEVWKGAKFHEVVTADQYNTVQVTWEGEPIADFPVLDDRQVSALMAKQAKVQNKVVGTVKKARDAMKSPSTTKEKIKKIVKKVSGKKAAKKAAKKVAKKVTKKAATPAPKKVAKKPAPKKSAKKKSARKASAKKTSAKPSSLKKFVKKLVKKLTPARKKGKKKR